MIVPDPFILESIDSAHRKKENMPDAKDGETCPVDHKSREAWLQQARSTHDAQPTQQPRPPPQPTPPTKSWTQTLYSYLPFTTSQPTGPNPLPNTPPHGSTAPKPNPLDTSRVVSSIPRSSTPGPAACPDNHEQETGADGRSGHWVYPSEKMFFDAMKRKGYETRAADMRTVVPIHNAVNERAWEEIKGWEGPYLEGLRCDGPRLHSFAGKNDRMTPKARINTLLGYAAPFDRHDWVVDRCGTKVEYVIDFYAGRPNGKGGPSFYLDVRPKLNTWEGVKMRFMRGTGLV